jgi:hypothetical protein
MADKIAALTLLFKHLGLLEAPVRRGVIRNSLPALLVSARERASS